ncbi:zinc metallopeptidase [bacterium]|nr:zinc metallopeptidase [bacterium]
MLLYYGIGLLGMALSGLAAWRVRSAFATYSQVPSSNGYTAAEAAHVMMRNAGITDVEIVPVAGQLSDHYDPTHKRLALSEGVYGSRSVAALGIACHEAGHAIQHAQGYFPLQITSALWKPAALGESMGLMVIVLGLMMGMVNIAMLGLILFGATLAFQLVTLPVEFDATARAKREIINAGIIHPSEREGVDAVLNAAALTYVAAAFTTILYFLYYASAITGRSDE